MIDFKDINFITGSRNDIQVGISKILKIMDDAGSNILTIYQEESDTGIRSWLSGRKCAFETYEDLNHILDTELFRIDYLLVDIYDNSTKGRIEDLESRIRNKTKLPIIFIIGNNEIRQGKAAIKINKYGTDWIRMRENVMFYQITSQSKPHSQHRGVPRLMKMYLIEDKINDWKCSMEDLEKAYIRDEKINQIFKEDDTDSEI